MFKKLNIWGWSVWVKNQQDSVYITVLNEYLNNKSKIIRVLKQDKETKVCLIDSLNGQFVIKDFTPSQKHLERFLKSWFKRDYYVNLFQQTSKLFHQEQVTINDFYLLALCKRWHYAHRYIMIIEFIDGEQLPLVVDWDDSLRESIRLIINELHKHHMVSGDIHRGNFIRQIKDGKIRLIDLSGKRSTALRRAEDFIKMEQNLGIVNEKQDWAYHVLKWKQVWRQKIRRVRGRR